MSRTVVRLIAIIVAAAMVLGMVVAGISAIGQPDPGHGAPLTGSGVHRVGAGSATMQP